MSDEPQKYRIELPWYLRYTVILIGLSLFVYALIVAQPVLVPFLFAVFIAVLLAPLCNRLERFKLPRILSAFISLIVAIAVLFGIGFFFYTQLLNFVDEIALIEQQLNELFNRFSGFINAYLDVDPEQPLENVQEAVVTFLQDNLEPLTRGALTAATTITMFFLIPVFVVLLLIFRDFLLEFIMRAFSGDREGRVIRIVHNVRDVLQNYLIGMLIVMLILAVLNSIILLVVGLDHALFFAVFAAVLNIIPFLGPIIGSVLPIIYALITMDSLIYPVIILLSFYIIQLFESNLFTPTIVGHKVSMNPLVTLLILLIGLQIWGLAGMILFIPISAILKEVFDEVEELRPYGFLLGTARVYGPGTPSTLFRDKLELLRKRYQD